MKSWISLFVLLTSMVAANPTSLIVPYGSSPKGAVLVSQLHPSLLDVASPLTRILIVAGKESDPEAGERTENVLRQIVATTADWQSRFPALSISTIEKPYPDAGEAPGTFPPQGKAYGDPVERESISLWRWIGMLAPDLVVEVRAGKTVSWSIPESTRIDLALGDSFAPRFPDNGNGLASALASQPVAKVGTIPAVSVRVSTANDLIPLLDAATARKPRSPARAEMLQRRARSPLQVARELSAVYGQQLDEVAYIPAMSLVGRLRLGELSGESAQREDVERIVRPYHSGEKPALPAKSNGSQQSGHLIFGELAKITRDPRYIELLRKAADLGFDDEGHARDVMPAHDQMSDAVFMGTPLLAMTARLTGEVKYRVMALRHVRFMVKLNQRADGLHRHSPVAPDQTSWGRGNGFVSLGWVLALSELPEDTAEFREMLTMFRDHLRAMMPHQDFLGMWHQVIDHPESYREFTVTAMTTFAIARGLRRGWLDRATYEPAVRSAWTQLKQRVAASGELVDVCTGTGKMKSLQEYLDRPAILGRDDRGGAMAFLVSTELAFAEREGVLALR